MFSRRTATLSATIPARRTPPTMIQASPPATPLRFFAFRRDFATGFGLGLARGGRARTGASAAACQEAISGPSNDAAEHVSLDWPLNFDRCPQSRGRGSGIARELALTRPDRTPRRRAQHGLAAADANREVRRT